MSNEQRHERGSAEPRTMPARDGNAWRRPVSPGWHLALDQDGVPVWVCNRPPLPTGGVYIRTRHGYDVAPHPFLVA